ncbi:lysophospholipid acyltransferase family protein [Neptunicoccus sediminis]|uniref:lysophospholipid acyltransferase family protein n=1 Tax=Neptunicoccus sediminis TaxID=1892596 RepID=UPI0008461DBC|nr:lysophospholipid acyltransferase family protein [Neptunicoccus sediminis]
MTTWDDGSRAVVKPFGVMGWLRCCLRVAAMAVIIFGLMGPMVMLRISGFTAAAQWVVGLACRGVLRVIGLPVILTGTPMPYGGAVVANHCSWLDIFTLNAVQKVLFVAKAEVQHWPLIGLIARSVGTIFIERRTSHAARHRALVLDYIARGHRLLFFPEGTSTDGQRVLPFRSTLFAAFMEPDVRERLWVQPVTLNYIAPAGEDPRFYGWWGDTAFAQDLFRVLAQGRQGRVEVVFHPPVQAATVACRKDMARLCEAAVRSGLHNPL